MFSDAYTTIEDGKAAQLLDQLNPMLDGSAFDIGQTRIISHSLPFYDGYALYEVSNLEVDPPRILSFVAKEDNAQSENIYIMDGTNEPIYKLNSAAPIFLNAETIKTYVRFFFFYVRGRHGRFNIIENVDDINWREEPAPAGRKALASMINAVDFKENSQNETYELSANIVFKDSLFASDIHVLENGTVSLTNQEMLVEDIPVLDDSFQQ